MSEFPVPAVILIDNRPCTTSLAIAEHFGKNHQHVLRDIRALIADCPSDFGLSNFGQSSYENEQGKQQPMYHVFFDGFMLLVMGYTGCKALEMKLAYIAAFNAMREKLENRQGLPETSISDLSPSDQNVIQALVKAIADRYPEAEQRSIYMQVWMRFRNHFRIGSYKQLPPERMADAVAYLANLKINEKKKAIEPRHESPCPARMTDDKYEAYIYDVESFRAETAAKIETLLHRGLGFVDVKKLGTGGIIAFTPILLDWLQRVAGQPSPILRRNEPVSRAIDYSPLYLIRHLEKVPLSQ